MWYFVVTVHQLRMEMLVLGIFLLVLMLVPLWVQHFQ